MANKLNSDVPVHTGIANDHDRIELLSLKQGNAALQIGGDRRLARDGSKSPFNLFSVTPVGIEQEYAAHWPHPSDCREGFTAGDQGRAAIVAERVESPESPGLTAPVDGAQ